jgi:hypothetical protein
MDGYENTTLDLSPVSSFLEHRGHGEYIFCYYSKSKLPIFSICDS